MTAQAQTADTGELTFNLRQNPKQNHVYWSKATEILYGGAAGGGKSACQRIMAIILACDIPGVQVYMFRRTFPELVLTHMTGPDSFPEMLAPWVRLGWAKIKGDSDIDIGKSRIHLRHCQYPKDVLKYQGSEMHVLMVDELTHWPENMYAYLRSRLRLGRLTVPDKWKGRLPMAINATNPGGVGHNWVKRCFVDPAKPFDLHRASKKDGGMLRQFIPATLRDNPYIDAKDYEEKLEGLGNPALVKAMLEGDWNIVSGGMFDDLWREDVHVLAPFDIPDSWRMDRSFDWGSARPYSVGWWAESDGTEIEDGRIWPRGTVFRISEIYGWNGRENEGTKETAKDVAGHILEHEETMGWHGRVRPGPADPSIYAVENGNCIARDMERAGVKWVKGNAKPGTRKLGWETVRGRLKASLEGEGPGLYVFTICRQFIRTVPVLPRLERDPDDVDTDAEDHIADETRYRLLGAGQTEVGKLEIF